LLAIFALALRVAARQPVILYSSFSSSLIGMRCVTKPSLTYRVGEQVMDEYQEELLEARATELDVPAGDEDATEL